MSHLRQRSRLAGIGVAVLLALAVLLAAGPHRTAPASATAGLQSGPATAFHIHARLRIFIDGRPVPVPAQIGIDPQGRFLAPLRTHDASGIVHVESVRPYPFTLGQFFTIWGVRFGDTRIGGYAGRGARRLRVFVDGRLVAHPAAHVLRAHDRIVVGYGAPGSFPTTDRTPFPPGL